MKKLKKKFTKKVLGEKLALEREKKERSEEVIFGIENYQKTAFKEIGVWGDKQLSFVVMPSDLVIHYFCKNCKRRIDKPGYCEEHSFSLN